MSRFSHIHTLLFDFDGTIADTLSASITIANKYAKSWGLRQVEEQEIERLKSLSPLEIMKEFKIPVYKVPFIIKKIQMELFDSMSTVRLFTGILETIHELEKRGYKLGIVTSNTQKNAEFFLKHNKIECFDFIYYVNLLRGKAHTIRQTLKEQKLDPKTVLYIGDELKDIEAARKNAIEIVSVTWGFNSKQLLQTHNEYIAENPQQLLRLLTK